MLMIWKKKVLMDEGVAGKVRTIATNAAANDYSFYSHFRIGFRSAAIGDTFHNFWAYKASS